MTQPTLFADLALGPVAELTAKGWRIDSPIARPPPWWGMRKGNYPDGPPYVRVVADHRTQVGDQLFVGGELLAVRIIARREDSNRVEWWRYVRERSSHRALDVGQVKLWRLQRSVGYPLGRSSRCVGASSRAGLRQKNTECRFSFTLLLHFVRNALRLCESGEGMDPSRTRRRDK